MKIAILIIQFNLPGCNSLKEKRQRMSAIRSKYGKQINIAICESAMHDCHQSSEWSFVITGLSNKIVDSSISSIENNLEMIVDATIYNIHRENLY